MKLQRKIGFLLAPLIVLPLFIVGWIAYEQLRIVSQHTILEQMTTLLKQLELHVQSTLQTARANITLFSHSSLIEKYLLIEDEADRYFLVQPALLKLFRSYHNAYPEYYEIRVLQPDGYEDTRSTRASIPNEQEEEGDTLYFQEMAKSQDAIYSTFFQNPDTNDVAFWISKKLMLSDQTIAPVLAKPTLRGYLVVTMDLTFLKQQVRDNRIGKEGIMFFTDDQGNLLLHPDEGLSGKLLPAGLFKQIVQNAQTESLFKAEYDGQMLIFQGKQLHPRLFLFAMLPEKELLAASRNLGIIVAGITLTSIIVIVSLVFFALKFSIIYPIQQLNRAAQEAGEGNLSVKLKTKKHDEIGSLATEFNNMLEHLHVRDQKLKEALDEYKKAKETAEEAQRMAESANQAKSEFLANMSHELRTPLHVILGTSEVLREKVYGELNDKILHCLSRIEESGRHLLKLITDILDLSKIEAGKVELNLRLVDVESICQMSLQFIRQEALKKRLKVSFMFDSSVITIRADERRLKQIFVNLLSNAVKFTPEGGRIGLEVEGDTECHLVRFTVWDTGIGIAREDIAHLFQPFVQLDASLSRQYEGTGLGLSLAHHLVEMHGGSISVESEVNKGSRFTVVLPWKELREMERGSWEDEEPKERTPHPPTTRSLQFPTAPTPANPMILLVDDNESTVQTLSEYLTAQKYRLMIARDGKEAVERARNTRPDLIVMDIHMPEMSGIEAIRYIRENEDMKYIPIIALTALAMPGDSERCLESGANEYLSKPVSLRELNARIKVLLANKELKTED